MKIKKTTPVFIVDTIEASLPFWEALGWSKTVDVKHGSALGFVILVNGTEEMMLQTRVSLEDDLEQTKLLAPKCVFYIEVESLDEAKASIKGGRVLVEERKTFYGAREAWVVDPAGILLGLAETSAAPAEK
ncbi:MAG TPA: hypothetical protein VF407_01305 [Polyangiaceae bacterium]